MNAIIIVFLLFMLVLILIFWYYYLYNESVIIAIIPNALTDDECDALIEYSKSSSMQQSTVINKNGGQYDVEMDQRNSKTIWYRDDEHHVANKMSLLASKYTNLPVTYQEKTQVVCYDIGGKFDAHYDAQYNSGAETRNYTCLVYLNDNYEGGETVFPYLDKIIKPEKGKMVIFRNLNAHGEILLNSQHKANPVKRNNKWICTKWIHSKPYVS